jgi:L-asparaginase II
MSLLAIANLLRKTPDRIRTAVQSNPHLSGGLHRPDTDLMVAQNKWFAKAASEGLFVARHETGLTIALKALNADCASIRPAFAMILDVIAGQQANSESMSETSLNPLASVLRDIEARQSRNRAVCGGWGVPDLEISEAQRSDFAVPHWRTTPVSTVHGDQVGSIEARPIPRDQVVEISAEPSFQADDQPADFREISVRKPRMPLAISTKGERFDRFETYLSDLFAPITAASLADSEAPEAAHAIHATRTAEKAAEHFA